MNTTTWEIELGKKFAYVLSSKYMQTLFKAWRGCSSHISYFVCWSRIGAAKPNNKSHTLRALFMVARTNVNRCQWKQSGFEIYCCKLNFIISKHSIQVRFNLFRLLFSFVIYGRNFKVKKMKLLRKCLYFGVFFFKFPKNISSVSKINFNQSSSCRYAR